MTALAIAGIKTTWKSNIGDLDTTAQDDPGSIYYGESKTYKYVKFTGTTAITAGDVVSYTTTDGFTVDNANTTVLAAGVAVTSLSTGTVYYGWIQIGGVATLNQALAGTPAVGDALTSSGATAGAVTKNAADNTAVCCFALHVANKIVMCLFAR